MQLNSTKAIISGGVSGLGYAVAQRLVAEGGQVTLLDVDQAKGEQALAELGSKALFVRTDVRSEAEMNEAVNRGREFMGGVSVAVACAGILGSGRALGREGPLPLENFSRVIDINLGGTFNLAKAAAAVMAENEPNEEGERGVIVNTASVAAYEGQIGQAAYGASKGGVVGLTLPLARELTRFGIRVMTVAPGLFLTPMADDIPPEIQESLAASVPFPARLGRPPEFADTVAFIIGNSYMNGSVIRVDGAIRVQPK